MPIMEEYLLKFPGNEALAASYVDKAVALDTVPEKKLGYVKDIAKSLYDQGKFVDAGRWYGKVLNLNHNYGKVDLYYAGYSDYRGGNYKTADSVFTIYQQKYPDDLYGWYLGARSKEGIDSSSALGLAKPDYEKIIAIADTMQDKSSIKDKLIPAYRYLVAYFYNIKGDKDSAIAFNNKILEVDPADATALKTKDALEAKKTTTQTPTPAPAKKK